MGKWATGRGLPVVHLSISPVGYVGGLPLHAFSKAVGLSSGELQNVRLVRQPVEHGRRQASIAKSLCPVSDT